MLNGDAHLSLAVEGELRFASDPLPNFQTDRAHDSAPRYTPQWPHTASYTRGMIIYLPARLRDALHAFDCFVVRSPVDSARLLIRSDIKYTLLLFDETEAGEELERFARSLPHREQTPVMFVKRAEGLGVLLDAVRRRL